MIAALVPAFRRILRTPPHTPPRAPLRTSSSPPPRILTAQPIDAPGLAATEPIDEAPSGFLGWFDSSHELRAGLQVVELGALPEGAALPMS